MRNMVLITATLLAAAAGPAQAQQFVFPITVRQNGSTVKFEYTESSVRVPREVDVVLQLTCPAPSNCTGLKAFVVRERTRSEISLTPGGTQQTPRSIIGADQIPPDSLLRVSLELAGTPEEVKIRTTPDERTPHAFLSESCDERLMVQGDFYDEENNRAQFVVSPVGTLLARPNEPIDENDAVFVYVVGSPEEVKNVRIHRSSEAREGGVISIQGSEVVLTDDANRLSMKLDRVERLSTRCAVRRADLGDFDSGRGKIKITRVGTGQGESDRELAEFDLTVNPLYSGAFTLGPVVTRNVDRTYDTLADRTIVEESTGLQTHYVVGYSHFLTGQRDPDKGGWGMGAMFAVKPNELLDHAFLGLSLDVSGAVFLTGGVHGGKSTQIDPQSGLSVGDKLPTGFNAVPTQDKWEWGGFVGLTFDVRAAAGLIRKAAAALVQGP